MPAPDGLAPGDALDLDLPDEAATAALAVALAALLRAGDVVELDGDLGTGKTTLVRHAAAALGVEEPVTSPTFAVAHRYVGRLPVSHLDLYRAAGPLSVEEVADLDAYLGEDAVAFVEWPAAGRGALPAPAWRVELRHVPGGGRAARVVRLA